jgi:hypothetical protein
MQFLLPLFLILVGATFVAGPKTSAQTGPSCQSNSLPTIEAIDPPSSPPWQYVTIYGCNLPYAPFPRDCTVTFGGVRGYVAGAYGGACGNLMLVAIPIAATSGPVVVTSNGPSSEPFPYDILALDVGPEDIVPGSIYVGVLEEVDIHPILVEMGQSAEDISDSFCVSPICWYGIEVPVGSEVETSIRYYSNSNVLWASPQPVPVPAMPLPAPPPAPQPPPELPRTGGPGESRGWGGALAVIVPLILSIGTIYMFRRARL